MANRDKTDSPVRDWRILSVRKRGELRLASPTSGIRRERRTAQRWCKR